MVGLGCLLLACSLSMAQTSSSGKTQTSAAGKAKTASSKSAKKKKTHSSHSTHSSSAKSSKKHSTTSTGSRKGKKSKKSVKRTRGQQKIDSERARQIQEALIREHYLSGQPTGMWDETTQSAMVRYQAENGWQSKTVPDSRALIKLGLGPSHEHLLNPDSAMTTSIAVPASTQRDSAISTSGSAPTIGGPNQPQK